MRYDRHIEQCEYCDVVHHPMTRWVHPVSGEMVFIHYIRVITLPNGKTDLLFEEENDCSRKAIELGFVKRLDLTPKR